LGDGSELDGLALADALDALVDVVMELGEASAATAAQRAWRR
jgi:hypothetical protein